MESFYQPGHKPGEPFPIKIVATLLFSILALFLILFFILGGSRSPDLPKYLYYYNEGNRYAAEYRYGKAKRAYQKAIKLNPHSILPYYELGNIMFKEGDYEEALRSFNRVKELAPDVASIYLRLSEVYRAKGMDGMAEGCLRRYEELRKEF